MNQQFKTKLFYCLINNRRSQGFTLIELLVVIIIIGVLAAISIPNLVRQAGKARETELKNAVGTINRAQQAYHWEKQSFAQGANDNATLDMLNLDFNSKYINSFNITTPTNSLATVAPSNTDFQKDQTRAYSGGVFVSGGNYSTVVCQSDAVAATTPPPTTSNNCGTGKVLR